jgi:glyoxylate reductase
MKRVVISKAVPDVLARDVLDGFEVVQGPTRREWTLDEVRPHLATCSGLVTWGFLRVDDELLDAAPALRVVANIAVGVDNLDLEALALRGVWATNTPTDFAAATAEVALGLMISVMRRVAEGERYIRAGSWHAPQPGRFDGPTLVGKTLGLVGFGTIAREVAARARAFGMDVAYHARHRVAEDVEQRYGATYLRLTDLLRAADVVSLHVPLTASTHHLIDARALATMRSSAYLVNTARGRVVDEQALVAALREGRIAGAGLDVFEHEPRVPAELLELSTVALSPHVGGAAIEARRAAQRTALRNVRSVLAEGLPLTAVNRLDEAGGRRSKG